MRAEMFDFVYRLVQDYGKKLAKMRREAMHLAC